MNKEMHLLVYPVKDIAKAKALYGDLLGVEPYVDGAYYVGFRAADLEIGLDPNGQSKGPIAYWDVDDIKASLRELLNAGALPDQDVQDVGAGLLIAKVKDADGNTLGLRQKP